MIAKIFSTKFFMTTRGSGIILNHALSEGNANVGINKNASNI